MLKSNHYILILISFLISSCVSYKELEKENALLAKQRIEGVKYTDRSVLENLIRNKPNRTFLGTGLRTPLAAYQRGEKYYEKQVSKDSAKLSDLNDYYETLINYKEKELLESIEDNRALLDSLYQLDIYETYAKVHEIEKRSVRDSIRGIRKLRKIKSKSISKTEKLNTRLEKGNWLMRSAGEPPSYFDIESSESAAKSIQRYLVTKGYLNAKVSYHYDTLQTEPYVFVREVFTVKENKPWMINKLVYDVKDREVLNFIMTYNKKSILKEKTQYSETKLQNERNRITKLLKNNGYFDFNTNYIKYEVDTNKTHLKVDVKLIIDSPADKDTHTKYYIKDIVVETDPNDKVASDSTEYDDITYIQHSKKYKEKILNGKMALKESKPFNESLTNDTRFFLSQMDAFKFVNIEYVKQGEDSLNANIYTSSFNKYQYAFETGLNVSRSLPGPFASISLKSRNIFRGAESLEFRGRFSLEAQASVTESSDELYNGTEYGFSTILKVPRPLIPFSAKLNDLYYYRTAKTKILSDVAYVSRPEYTRLNIKGQFGYEWRNRKEDLFEFSLADLNVIRTPFLSNDFRVRLQQLAEQGNTLHYSFDNSFVTSSHLSMSRMRGNYVTGTSKASYIKLFGEVGGNFLDIVNDWTGSQPGSIYGLRYYKFYKLYFDLRRVVPIGEKKKHIFASRIHMGVAKSYGEVDALPYEKYFFSGGGNSNRAWRPRRLGPGSYTPPQRENGTFDYSYEQPGDMIMEFNVEWRYKISRLLQWAFFIDASNVWLLEEDQTRPGGNFEFSRFWKEFGIGAGVGARLDFSFLIIRLDVGTKIFDPARQEGYRFIAGYDFLGKGTTEFNIGIGYPF
ncbi:BamA/TamA family outer membrane protein [Flammeovirga yaeyamensis]|uniref:BamA/TamA family outer membrane protein n=1 Tax=Flammeovirga yaeyamensis TaxID=367791 RepID=A0AAX1N2N3_9BACT|nr:BamA/TamA family outer membrane protein [Flammeovirga yaeyamensis]MBB3696392.1 outer membrane protein assembly factor BamA [Flammeovirga yaeyamensis]NMF35071.1 BamA/TamA family outer membrane protein [Flammeovirga yaeyamensis]QWG00108.1 BamA/TamA family outer membrane protein [Flammeovirga yaeyamensis]